MNETGEQGKNALFHNRSHPFFSFFSRSYENNKLCTKGTQKDNDYREHHKND